MAYSSNDSLKKHEVKFCTSSEYGNIQALEK
jgi:hypothetical protein